LDGVLCVLQYEIVPFRLKDLKQPIYTQHEAEAAAGMGNYSLSAPPTSAEVIAMEDDNNSTDSNSDL